MEKTKKKTKKALSSVAKTRRAATETTSKPNSLESPAGLRILSLGPGEIMARDHRGEVHKLLPKDLWGFHPKPVQATQKVSAPLPGLTMAAPSSVLWVELESLQVDCSFILDPTELDRHGARWGRPVLLSYVTGGKGDKSVGWQMVMSRTEVKLAAGESLLLVGVGHGLMLDPLEIFSSLSMPKKGEFNAS